MNGVLPPGNRQVGADAAGTNAALQSLPGHVEAEVLPAVGRVQEDAALLRLQYLGDDLAVAADDASGVAAEQVGDDVAVLQQRQQLLSERGAVGADYAAVADVHHETHAAFRGRLLGQANHLDAHAGHAGAHGADFDALD